MAEEDDAAALVVHVVARHFQTPRRRGEREDALRHGREPDGRVSASIGAFVGISAGVSSGAVARRPRHGEHLGEPLPQMRQHAVGIGITSQRYRTHRRPPSACSPAGRR